MGKTIGLITDDVATLSRLHGLLDELSQYITFSLLAEQVFHSSVLTPSVWIVISEQAVEILDHLNEWSPALIFFADHLPDENIEQWKSGLCKKIQKTLDESSQKTAQSPPFSIAALEQLNFKEVWVLAASLGGPEAVRIFLAHIHPDLPVSFIYAQHIEQNFDKMLPKAVGKHSHFNVSYAQDGESLSRGNVTVIPSHHVAQIDSRGRLHVFDRPWQKPYTPNIDQVILNVGDYFAPRMGVIIFSGMCDDGAKSAIALKAHNVPLWAQLPSECICSAMPEAVIEHNATDFIGSAENLAKQLNRRFGKH